MRLVFLGKGGSGKTTLSTMFAMHCIENSFSTLTIDGDVNIHLGPALNVPDNKVCLSDDYEKLFKALEGEHPYYKETGVIPSCGSLPASKWSNLVSLDEENSILKEFAWKSEDHPWWHVKLGNYGEVGNGGDCYHYKQNALELFAHRINDSQFDIVMSDATAGIDHLATSLARAYDLCVFSVEPTKKSVSVAKDFFELAQKANISVVFVGNKIETEEDIEFINQNLDCYLSGYVPYIEGLGHSEEEDYETLLANSKRLEKLFASIIDEGAEIFKTRDKQLEAIVSIYKRECTDYWNAHQGADLLPYLEGNV